MHAYCKMRETKRCSAAFIHWTSLNSLHLTAALAESKGNMVQEEPLSLYVCKAKQLVVYMTGAIYLKSICVN